MFQKQQLVFFFFFSILSEPNALMAYRGGQSYVCLIKKPVVQFDIHKLGQYLYNLINGTVSQIQVVATFRCLKFFSVRRHAWHLWHLLANQRLGCEGELLLKDDIASSTVAVFWIRPTKERYTLPVNPLNPELNPICCLLALLAHHFLHVSRIRVKLLTSRLLMSYIHGAPILDVSRSHTTTQHSR